MSAPLRFLAFIAVGWIAFRVGAMSAFPGTEPLGLNAEQAAAAQPPPIARTEFPPLEPPGPEQPAGYPQYLGYAAYPPHPPYPQIAPVPVRLPVYYPAYYPPATPAAAPLPAGRAPLYDLTPLPPAEEWSLSQLSPTSLPVKPRAVSTPVVTAAPVAPKLDRLQLSSWALLRGRSSSSTLATGGTLGGSQAGARLTYAFDRRLAAQLRTASPVGGGRGLEVAVGARYQPLRSIPLWINAERRQAVGDYGRSAFVVFAEGGLYQQPMPWTLMLDAYLQGGVVGFSSRDLFVDGGFTLSRPVVRQFSAGMGVWGGAQPGLYRVDAGPRLSIKVRNNVRVHADWRQRLAGKADPGSGPALTLAADF